MIDSNKNKKYQVIRISLFFRGYSLRVVKKGKMCGKLVNILFDTGALNSYVRMEIINNECILGKINEVPHVVILGGKKIRVTKKYVISCEIDGVVFSIYAVPVDDLGTIRTPEGEIKLDVIIGALDMERWGIIVIPSKNDVDLSAIKKGEFVEY